MKNIAILILLICLGNTQFFAQPTADFTVDVTEGCEYLTVSFTDTSVGNVASYEWDFGDGNTSMVMNPVHTYEYNLNNSTITVCLTVTDDQALSDELCMTDLITIYPSPQVSINDVLCPGESITINGNVYDENQSQGVEVIPNITVNGCDSTLNINLSFYPVALTQLYLDVCSDYTGPLFTTDTFPNASYQNCDSIVEVYITVLPEVTTSFEPVLCDGESVIVNGNLYDINNPVGTEVMLDMYGCDSIVNVNLSFVPVDELGLIEATVSPIPCGMSTGGSVCITNVQCGVGPYTYNWGPPGGTESCLNDLGPGIYEVSVSDALGNTGIETFLVGISSSLEVDVATTDVSCNGGTDGSAVLNVINGMPPYIYETSIGVDLNNLAAGSYDVTITDVAACSVIETVEISEPMELVIFPGAQNANCGDPICVDLSMVIGGVAPYSIMWSGGETDFEVCDLPGGLYEATITDANNCTLEFSTTIVAPPLITVTGVSTCATPGNNDGAIDITVIGGVAPYFYNWSNGMITEDIFGLYDGQYTVTVSDFTGCTAEAIFETNDLIIAMTQDTTVCSLSPFQLFVDAPSAVTYDWILNPQSLDDPTIANPTIIDFDMGSAFWVTVANAEGCEDDGQVFISSADQFTGIVESQTNPSCTPGNDGAISILPICGTAPYSYSWDPVLPDNNIQTGLPAGTYSVTITDDTGATADINQIELVDNDDFLVNIEGPDKVCDGESVTICVSPTYPGISYEWTGPNGFASLGECITWTISDVLYEGTYTVSVTDAQGCTGVQMHDLDVLFFNELVDYVEDEAICSGENTLITITEPQAVAVTWTPAIGLSCSDCLTPIASPSVTTTYTAIVDIGTCMYVEEVTVFVDEYEIVEVEDVTICEGEALSVCMLPVAGDNQDSTIWTVPNPGGGITFSLLCMDIAAVTPADAGTYTAIAYYEGGCTDTMEFEVTIDGGPLVISPDVQICAGNSTNILVTGAGIATIAWTPDDGSLSCTDCLDPIASPLSTTTYMASVITLNGCTANASVSIIVDPGCVWPGDTDTNKIVNNFDLLNIGLAYDSVGPTRPGANLMWIGQESPDWTQIAPNGTNYKHIDTDGNGLINSDDTLAITSNWLQTHNFSGKPIPTFPPSEGLTLTVPFYVQPDTLIEGAMMNLPVILGEAGNPAENVYGIAFTLEYDSAVVVPGSVYMGFDQSWLGNGDVDLISIHRDFFNENKVDIGMTRIDGLPMTDFGTLAQLFITVEDDLLLMGGGDDRLLALTEAVFNITNVLVINQYGESIPVIPMETTAEIGGTTGIHTQTLADRIDIYPNPTNEVFWVDTKNIKLETIEITDVNGRTVRTISVVGPGRQEIDMNRLDVGTYFVKVMTEEGVYVDRVLVIR